MKKTYEQPEIQVVKLNTKNLVLEGSQIGEGDDNKEADVKDASSNLKNQGIWDNEW